MTGMKRKVRVEAGALAVLLVSTLLLKLWAPAPAYAADVNVTLLDFRVATFSGSPVYSERFSFGITPKFDFVVADSFQPAGGPTGNLLDVGIRYHFEAPFWTEAPPPAVDSFLQVGFVSENGPFPGLGFANASGLSVGAGATIRLTSRLIGYASGSIVSWAGTSNSVIDLGLQLQLASPLYIYDELGDISFAGSGAPYLGINFILPSFSF